MRDVKRAGALLLVCVAVALLPAADWPQFRGPDRDGVSSETGLRHDWESSPPRELWRIGLGEGYSGISGAGGRLFTMYGKGGDEFVVALDPAGGSVVWRQRVDTKWKDRWGNGPRSTPTVEAGVVYALTSRNNLVALDAKQGNVIWKRDLEREYGGRPPHWGASASPLVEGKMVLIDAGGRNGSSIVAFDKKTGKELWHSQDDKAGYSAPIAVTIDGVRQVVFLTGTRLVALNPEDGSLLWRVPWKTSYDVNAATPVFVPPDGIFVSTGYDVGGALYRIQASEGAAEVDEVWKNREMKNKFSSSVLHEGHLYGFDEKTLKCVSAASGETLWRARGLGHGSLIYADGHVIVLGEEGTLVLVEATHEEYRERGRLQPFEGRTWTMPTLVGGKLYLRDQTEVVSLDISG